MSLLMQQQALSSLIELIINQAIKLNRHPIHALQPLEQKTLVLYLAELNFPLAFSCFQQEVLVTGNVQNADCTITTSIKIIAKLQKNISVSELIKQDLLDIEGDLKVAQQFAAIADNLSIDWQSELAKHIGDIPTYKLGQLNKLIIEKLTFAQQQIKADASEWLVHEKKLIVAQHEINRFSQSVEQVSHATNQLANKIEQLYQLALQKENA